MENLETKISNIEKMIHTIGINQQELVSAFGHLVEAHDQLLKENTEMKKMIMEARGYAINAQKSADESVWGMVFENAIKDSMWLKKQTFYPGRWAAGYQLLYVLFRILNDAKPTHILELGLGQTTRIISQYVNATATASHRIIEHDQEWIKFFDGDFPLTKRNEIVQLGLGRERFLEDENVLVYCDFKAGVSGRKYDLISIDAPFGAQPGTTYSRIDVLKLIPQQLADSFVIVVDDAERSGEQKMISALKAILNQNNIRYAEGIYCGNKTAYVIASLDRKFLCTL
jgi:hypothetical protein